VFLQEHFHVRNCTYISSFCEAVSGEGVHRIPLNRSLREIVGYSRSLATFKIFRIRVSISASVTVGFMHVNFRH
jgi:hypothetical protein